MGLRFRKIVGLGKLARLNISRGGISLSLGKPGASINIGRNGVSGTAGIPGSGLSYRQQLTRRSGSKAKRSLGCLVPLLFVAALVACAIWFWS